MVTCRHAGSSGGSSVTCAHCGALPRRIVVVQHRRSAAQARRPPRGPPVGSAGSCRGSPPPRGRRRRARSSTLARPAARSRSTRQAREQLVDGPSPATVRTVHPSSREARAPTSRRRPRRRRDARAGTTRRRPSGTAARYRPSRRSPTRGAAARGRAWRDDAAGGFCVPNATTYPWQWLWDSCFHAVVWAHLGDERAVVELRTALSRAGRRRLRAPPALRRRRRTRTRRSGAAPAPSTITQPPMYGHAVAELARLGLAARRRGRRAGRARACEFLLRAGAGSRRRASWSSATRGSRAATTARGGTTPCPAGARPRRWFDRKGELVASIERTPSGAPLHNPAFAVGSVGLHRARGVERAASWRRSPATTTSRRAARELAGAIDDRWDAELRDLGRRRPDRGRVGADPHARRAAARRSCARGPRCSTTLLDPAAYGAPCGPRGVHAGEPTYEPAALLARPGVAAAHLPALAGRHQLGLRRRRARRCRGRWWRVRSARGTRSTGWPTPASRSEPCPRPGRRSRWPCAAGALSRRDDRGRGPAAAQLAHGVGGADDRR